MTAASESVTFSADWTLAASRARRRTALWLACLLAVFAAIELAVRWPRRELPLGTAAVAIVVGAFATFAVRSYTRRLATSVTLLSTGIEIASANSRCLIPYGSIAAVSATETRECADKGNLQLHGMGYAEHNTIVDLMLIRNVEKHQELARAIFERISQRENRITRG